MFIAIQIKKQTCHSDSNIQFYLELRLIQVYLDFRQKNERHLSWDILFISQSICPCLVDSNDR